MAAVLYFRENAAIPSVMSQYGGGPWPEISVTMTAPAASRVSALEG
jgi:hypothetical protein